MSSSDPSPLGRYVDHPPRCWYHKARRTPVQGQTHYPCSCGLIALLDTLPDGVLTDADITRIRFQTPIDTPEWLRRSK